MMHRVRDCVHCWYMMVMLSSVKCAVSVCVMVLVISFFSTLCYKDVLSDLMTAIWWQHFLHSILCLMLGFLFFGVGWGEGGKQSLTSVLISLWF